MTKNSEIPQGYKQTKVGVIPEEWSYKEIGAIADIVGGGTPSTVNEEYWNGDINWFTPTEIKSKYVKSSLRKISKKGLKNSSAKLLPINTILLTTRATIGEASIALEESTTNQGFQSLISKKETNHLFLYDLIRFYKNELIRRANGSTFLEISKKEIEKIKLPIPPLPEQERIASCLTTWDKGIEKLSALIQAKKQQKKGLMQQLLTGKKRLEGFTEEWKERSLKEIAYCLNNVRVPLNSEERNEMKGDIPYCGANGIVDYVNDYVIDDDIILLAEDGGYFDEYNTRPIAYRMNGKVWVNNHAHILKAKENFNHSFLFYSLVHKNVMPYITGGTRAKLNKASLLQIKILAPTCEKEQSEISGVLLKSDKEIDLLEKKLEAMQLQKQGLMQVLLTGQKRLIFND